MQNIQILKNCSSVNIYFCKYIGKIDEQNYVVIYVDEKGQLFSKGQFIHKTKISTSKKNEEDSRVKDRFNNHPQGRVISHNEIVHLLLRYLEIITNLSFIHVSTLPLEFLTGSEKIYKTYRIPIHRRNYNQRDRIQVNVFNGIQDSSYLDIFISNRIQNYI